ncbi:TIGR02266 family protein [Myxococcaceae bacterium GXIMD 01537]
MSPSPAHSSPSREAELTRAESELAGQETRLTEQVARALSEATALAGRLERARSELARPEVSEDASLIELGARLQAAALPALDVDGSRARAIAAREQALEVRRQASEDVQDALREFQQHTSGLAQQVAEAEAGLKRAAEAAARARREQEARLRREQEAARAPKAAPRPAPAAPAPASGFASAAPKRSREQGRVKLKAAIDLRSDSNFFTGFATNVSEGGVFVATVEAVPRGTQVDLDFTLPGGRPLHVSGVVRWSREVSDRNPDLMPGIGVQFANLAPEVASAISEFVARREPLFYPD